MRMIRQLFRRNLDGESRLERIGLTAVMFIVAGLALVPLYWMVRSSLMYRPDHFLTPTPLLPPRITIDAYITLANTPMFERQVLNSFLVAGLATVNALVVTTLAAYALSRLRFRGRSGVFLLFIGTILVPAQISIVPLFLVARALGMYDSYAGMVLPLSVSGFLVFLLRQFFLRIPRDFEDAARIDGCNQLQVLWFVILPLSRPALAVVALTVMIWNWDEYLWPLIVTRSDDIRPAAVGIPKLFSGLYVEQQPSVLAAALLVLTIPAIVLAFVGLNSFVKGLSSGAIKG